MKKLSPRAQAVLIKLGGVVICNKPGIISPSICRACPHGVPHECYDLCAEGNGCGRARCSCLHVELTKLEGKTIEAPPKPEVDLAKRLLASLR